MYQRKVSHFMQFSLLRNKNYKKILIFTFTVLLFLAVSFLVIYQTNFAQGKVWSYLESGDDRFQMMRIEGLYHSLQRHQFFPLVNMSFMGGFGYIVNVFYSDFVLYPAAFFRLMGLTSAQTLGMYYLLVNFLTFGVSFLCFYKVSHKYINSLVFSFVYTLSTYRLYDVLFRHDLSEVGAMLFLPIAILGIYQIFYGNKNEWLYLAFGMTGIVYSQAISPILMIIFIIIVALCQIPELRENPQRLLSLLWATIISGLLSLAYFLPMFQQMSHTQFVFNTSQNILNNGSSDLTDTISWGVNNDVEQPNVGLVLVLAAIIIMIVQTKIKNKAVRHFSLIGIGLLICSTNVFPWFLFNNTILGVVKYTWHWNVLVTILLAIFVAVDPLNFLSGKFSKPLLLLFVFLLAISASYRLVQDAPLQLNSVEEYNQLDSYNLDQNRSFLPVGTRLSSLQRMSHKPKIISGRAEISDFKQYGTRMSFDFKKAKHAKIDVPLIAYYGFQSSQSKGQVSKLKVDVRNNNLAQVKINGSGKVVIDYFETTTQKVTRRISFLSLLIIVALLFINKLNLVDFKKIEGIRSK